jgi:gamma-glutamylcyclotransferase (GGCT)/AIG2-like uncharacterized protein YtfP
MRRPLFVYGTLRHGYPNRYARLLERSARHLGTARIQGRLYKVSWYPGVQVLRGGESAGNKDTVVGDLFHLRDPKILATLDQYEGSNEYRRVPATATLPDGSRIRCWVYEFIGGVMESQRVPSGDWFDVT